MKQKRLIASSLTVLLAAVQAGAWTVALRASPSGADTSVGRWLDAMLATLSEPALLAAGGIGCIVLGVGVGMVGRARQSPQAVPHLPQTEPAGAH